MQHNYRTNRWLSARPGMNGVGQIRPAAHTQLLGRNVRFAECHFSNIDEQIKSYASDLGMS
ncbi:MAG: hypothetical protein OEZ39_09100 [Gammaproteobacteria bacterium]|nr:hypothetical protein [Gammaproteobacteria bacterium]MDH5652000.1 hypothetical protein [Gammaproteobacteria bacterium]